MVQKQSVYSKVGFNYKSGIKRPLVAVSDCNTMNYAQCFFGGIESIYSIFYLIKHSSQITPNNINVPTAP